MPITDIFCWGQSKSYTPALAAQPSFLGPQDRKQFQRQTSEPNIPTTPKRQWSKQFKPKRSSSQKDIHHPIYRDTLPQYKEKPEIENIEPVLPLRSPLHRITEKVVPPTPASKITRLQEGGDLSAIFKFVEQNFGSYFRISSSIYSTGQFPQISECIERTSVYRWKQPGLNFPRYPPHLETIPSHLEVGVLQLFESQKLLCASALLLPDIPRMISDHLYGDPIGKTISGLEARMARLRRANKNLAVEPSVANRPDWYSDSVFAQQAFTGPNPASITQASLPWIRRFKNAAQSQSNVRMYVLLCDTAPRQLFIQDYSYFRLAVETSSESMLRSEDGKRFGCASVTLFLLTPSGELHPLSIVLDYKGGMENSVVIFNSRLDSSNTPGLESEARDWPWRYAKMCHQVADWTHHELRVNLTECHFVQEAIIVATQRSFPEDHIVFRLLEPHWLKTLPINQLARDHLVPEVITKLTGFTREQTYKFISNVYENYDFTKNYLLDNLERRGFSPKELHHTDFHNYAWARNMSVLYPDIHAYIHSVLKTQYELPTDVKSDEYISTWVAELQNSGNLTSFPTINTLAELTDALTHIVFLSGPFHHSISRLQTYYQGFVPNKPPCLMRPLPTSLNQLLKFTEADIIASLPVNGDDYDNKIWLMASQFAWLCSGGRTRVDENWGTYLKGVIGESRIRKGKAAGNQEKWKQADAIEKAARRCYEEMSVVGEGWMGNWAAVDEDFRVRSEEVEPLEMGISILC